jgi:hypothetical protein
VVFHSHRAGCAVGIEEFPCPADRRLLEQHQSLGVASRGQQQQQQPKGDPGESPGSRRGVKAALARSGVPGCYFPQTIRRGDRVVIPPTQVSASAAPESPMISAIACYGALGRQLPLPALLTALGQRSPLRLNLVNYGSSSQSIACQSGRQSAAVAA